MASSSPAVIRDHNTAGQTLQLVNKCLNSADVATLHQSLRALNAILTELTDQNAAPAKDLLQKAIPAIEKIANAGEADWAVEAFQVFHNCLECPVQLLNGDSLKVRVFQKNFLASFLFVFKQFQ